MKKSNATVEELPKWKIPVTWQMCGFVYIDALTLEEAMEIAKDEDGQIPLPIDGNYVDGSWELSDPNPDYVRECYNNNQKNKILGENQHE